MHTYTQEIRNKVVTDPGARKGSYVCTNVLRINAYYSHMRVYVSACVYEHSYMICL